MLQRHHINTSRPCSGFGDMLRGALEIVSFYYYYYYYYYYYIYFFTLVKTRVGKIKKSTKRFEVEQEGWLSPTERATAG